MLPGAADLAGLAYMAFADVTGIRVCRTGYTGEHGYELLVPADEARRGVGRAARRRGAARRAAVPGSAARDTLRTEMGYPLHGQDLSGDITPVQAGSGWAVGLDEAGVLGTRRAGGGEGGRAGAAAARAAGHRARRAPAGDDGARAAASPWA